MPIVLPAAPATGGPTAPPTLAQALALIRQDLSDQLPTVAGAPPTRWSDADLTRALDRAVARYSFVAPWLQQVSVPTLPQVRLYPVPATAWWVESVEYPIGLQPRRYVAFSESVTPLVAAPPYPAPATTLPALVDGGPAGAGMGLSAGPYWYRLTYLTPGGESLPSPSIGPLTLPAAGHAALLNGLPTGPRGAVVGRALYRTAAGGAPGSELLCQTIPDVTTTLLLDATPDGARTTPPPAQDGTAGVASVTLRIPTSQLPTATSPLLTLTTASQHVVGPSGSSIPAWHRDTVLLGAAAYALLAYQVPTNDAFEYQDGEMRDRVDQRAVPGQWLTTANAWLTRFLRGLDDIRHQSDATRASVAVWGDKPARWDRL